MTALSTLLLALILGGIVAYAVAKVALGILNTQDGIPLKIKLVLAFIMFALGEGLIFFFTDGGDFAVSTAYTLGFMAVLFSYDLVFNGRDKS